jgi:hypothetical protein
MVALSAIAHAAGTLRIVPVVRDDQVMVSIDLDGGYTDEVREVINGGVRTTFTYDVTLKMIVPAWVDRTISPEPWTAASSKPTRPGAKPWPRNGSPR